MIRVLRTAELAPDRVVATLGRPHPTTDPDAVARVAAIVDEVRRRGDAALVEFTKRFDGVELEPEELRVSDREWAAATVPAPLGAALVEAARRIEAFHRHQLPRSWWVRDEHGSLLGQQVTPLERVGCYVPGGTAAYPSTVLMNLIPARVAGVRELVVVSPPGADGQLPPAVLVAARLAGATEVYRAGGAQAVAALAYGTAAIPAVDKIVGPGNLYVALAKRLVFGDVGIDLVAGPSEVVVVADRTASASHVAADLLAQAEHDPMARAVCLTDDAALGAAVAAEVARQCPALPRAAIAEAAHPEPRRRRRDPGPRGGRDDRESSGARAPGARGRRPVRVAAGHPPCGGDLPGPPYPRSGRRLPGGAESRPADGRRRLASRRACPWRTS